MWGAIEGPLVAIFKIFRTPHVIYHENTVTTLLYNAPRVSPRPIFLALGTFLTFLTPLT